MGDQGSHQSEKKLPAGWSEGKLDDGRTYYFDLANPSAVVFEFPRAATQQQQQQQTVAQASAELRRCVALHAWDRQAGAISDTDLLFAADDSIIVVSEKPGQGWLTGRLVGDRLERTGIFPANFVRYRDATSSLRARTPDPEDTEDVGRPRSPDPEPEDVTGTAVVVSAATDADEDLSAGVSREEKWNAAKMEVQVKNKGAYVYDKATGQWKLNAELEAKQQAQQEAYELYRNLFQQCANEVAALRRGYDKGIKARFRSIAALSKSLGSDSSKWTQETLTDARWSSIEAAASASRFRQGAPTAEARSQRQQLDEVEEAVMTLQPHDMVELYGIANKARQHLNGRYGEVLKVRGDDGRCLVRISLHDGSQVEKRVRMSQIRRVAPLTIGDTAEIVGLPSSNLLNGAHGTVKAYDPKQQLFVVAMPGAPDNDGLTETVMRSFAPNNVRRVSSLKVGDEVEVHGLTGTMSMLNGCTMYIHRWDSVQRQFACANISADELQARRDARKQQMEERRQGRKVLIHHDPISGTTSYDTTGDGLPDAYDTTGDMQIDTFMEVPLEEFTEEQETRHFIKVRNLRRKAQWEQGDQVVIHSLQSLEGQRLNGMHGTIVAYSSGRYVIDVSRRDDEALKKISPQYLRRVGALQSGDTAQVHGLTGDPERVALNGLKAVVKTYVPENASFVVSVMLDAARGDDEDQDHRSRKPEEFRIPAVNLRPSIRENLERRLKIIFDTLDVDNSGSITRDELEKMSASLDVEVRDMLSAVLLAAREQQLASGKEETGSVKQVEVPLDLFDYLDKKEIISPRYVPNSEGDLEGIDGEMDHFQKNLATQSQGDGVVTWEEFRALLGPDEADAPEEAAPEPEPEVEPEQEPALVAAAVAMIGDDSSSWKAYTTVAGALDRVKMERTKLFDELELEVGRKREKVAREKAKQDIVVRQKMRAFKKTQELELEVFDQMQADGQSSAASSDGGSEASHTAEQQKDLIAEQQAFIASQKMEYEMKELSLQQQVHKKVANQEKQCEKGVAAARKHKLGQLENNAQGVIIKSGVHRESLCLNVGNLVVRGEEGANAVIWPIDREPAVQIEATKPRPLRVGSQVKVLNTPERVLDGLNRAIIKAIINPAGTTSQQKLQYKIAYDASYGETYTSDWNPGLVVVDADNVVLSRPTGSEAPSMGALSISALTIAPSDMMTVVGVKPVAMWADSEYGLSVEAGKVTDVGIGTVVEVIEVKEWMRRDQQFDAQRLAERQEAERLKDEEECARILEEYDGDLPALRKAMAKHNKLKDKKKAKTKRRKSRKEVELGTWVRCRVVEMAPLIGPGPFEDTDVHFVAPEESQRASGWMLAITKTPPKVHANLLPWAIPPVDSWTVDGVKQTGLSTEPADIRQAAADAESMRHALQRDLKMPNSGTAVDLQHLQLVSNSDAGSVLVRNGAKLTLSHGCTVRNSGIQAGHGVVAHPGSQITLENATVAHCVGVGVLIHGGVAAKLIGVDIGHCGKGGISAAKGSTLSVDKSRIHQCTGPGIRAHAPSAGGLVVRNCEIACIRDGAGIEMVDAVKKPALKTAATAALLSARSQGPQKVSAVAPPDGNSDCTEGVRKPEPPSAPMISAAEAAAEAWLLEAGVSWRRPSLPSVNDEDGSADDNQDSQETYSDEDDQPQRGMYPGALRVHPFLQNRNEEPDAAKETVRADGGVPEREDRVEAVGSQHDEGTDTGSGSELKSKAAKKKKLTKSQQRKKEQEEAEQRAMEEKLQHEKLMRLEWPIVYQTMIWGCGTCGISVVGRFDGTIRDNVIELNSAEGVRLSEQAGGTVRANRLQSNGLEGLTRIRGVAGGGQLGAEPAETLIEDNCGQNWCIGATVTSKVQQRLDLLPPTSAWWPDAIEWRVSTKRELGNAELGYCVPKLNRE